MLSKKDFIDKIRRNDIAIFPLIPKNIESATICVTASQYAWLLDKEEIHKYCGKPKIINADSKDEEIERIEIPPRGTVAIITKEAFSLNETISGIVLARVDIMLRGLIIVSNPLKPYRTEHLKIVVHNPQDIPKTIDVGERIAVVMLFKISAGDNSERTEEEKDLRKFLDACDNYNGKKERLKELQYSCSTKGNLISRMNSDIMEKMQELEDKIDNEHDPVMKDDLKETYSEYEMYKPQTSPHPTSVFKKINFAINPRIVISGLLFLIEVGLFMCLLLGTIPAPEPIKTNMTSIFAGLFSITVPVFLAFIMNSPNNKNK
jgi:deoxycytidine triphosphate deaminase